MMRNLLIAVASATCLAGCVSRAEPGSQRAVLAVTLTGTQEVPGPGDADGTGTVEIEVDPPTGQLCWNLYARQIEPATAAHIHRGAAGVAGPPVMTLTTPDAAGRSEGCGQIDPALAREIVLRAHGFYVNVHTAAQPGGAIRGQLRGGGLAPRRVMTPGG